MYQEIKQKVRNRIILWSVIPAVMGILTLMFAFLRSNLADLPFKFKVFMLSISGVFFAAMIIYRPWHFSSRSAWSISIR